jgi:flagellar FliL protein
VEQQMAKDTRPADDDAGEDTPKKQAGSSSLKKILLISLGVVVLLGLSVGGTVLTMNLVAKPEPVKKAAKKKTTDEENEEAATKEDKAAADDKAEGQDKAEAESEGDKNPDGTQRLAVYLDFDQPFVVNFHDDGQLRYLQITVSVMATDPGVMEEVKRHMPLIRNNLVMLFSGQTRDTVLPREGKEKIRKEAEVEVQKILTAQTGAPGIKSLYFTSFVMQ